MNMFRLLSCSENQNQCTLEMIHNKGIQFIYLFFRHGPELYPSWPLGHHANICTKETVLSRLLPAEDPNSHPTNYRPIALLFARCKSFKSKRRAGVISSDLYYCVPAPLWLRRWHDEMVFWEFLLLCYTI